MAKFSAKNFSENLNRLLDEAKISLAELSKNTDIAIPTFYRYMSNSNSNPTITNLQSIAEFFGVTIDDLISGKTSHQSSAKGHYRENRKLWDTVPLLSWKESINWNDHLSDKDKPSISTDIQLSEKAYALKMEEDLDDGFRKDSIIIVDPDIKPSDKDYVITYKNDSKPNLKKIQKYEGSLYLKPLVSGIAATLFTDEYIVLGVVRQIKISL